MFKSTCEKACKSRARGTFQVFSKHRKRFVMPVNSYKKKCGLNAFSIKQLPFMQRGVLQGNVVIKLFLLFTLHSLHDV